MSVGCQQASSSPRTSCFDGQGGQQQFSNQPLPKLQPSSGMFVLTASKFPLPLIDGKYINQHKQGVHRIGWRDKTDGIWVTPVWEACNEKLSCLNILLDPFFHRTIEELHLAFESLPHSRWERHPLSNPFFTHQKSLQRGLRECGKPHVKVVFSNN